MSVIDSERETARKKYLGRWLAACAAAVVLLAVKIIRTDDPTAWIVGVVIALVLIVPTFVGARLWLRSRVAKAELAAGPGGYAAYCGLSDDPQNAYLLIAAERGLAVRSANGRRTVLECAWSDVRQAEVATVVIGPWRRPGVRVEFANGALMDVAFPGPWLVNYPVELAQRASAEITRRLGAALL